MQSCKLTAYLEKKNQMRQDRARVLSGNPDVGSESQSPNPRLLNRAQAKASFTQAGAGLAAEGI